MTRKQAQIIIDAHELYYLLENGEEMRLLQEHNPKLHDAYTALMLIADGTIFCTASGWTKHLSKHK